MKAAQRQFLWTVDAIKLPGGFGQKSGGEVTSDSTKVFDGGDTIPAVIASPPETGDVTLIRAYDPELHQEVLTNLLSRVGQLRTTITGQPLAGDMTVIRGAKPRVYPDALLIGVREPESDASSGDAADWEVTFAVPKAG